MPDKFRTGDAALTGRVSYLVNMPNAIWFWAEVADALSDMTDPDNWIEVGTVTVEEAREAAQGMFDMFGPQIGAIFPFITSTPPDNCLECDGATYDREDYPQLYAALDSAFVIDADTFFVPDLRGRTVIGAGTGSGLSARSVGASGGAETHTLTLSEIPTHSHTYVPPVPNIDLETPGVPDIVAAGIGFPTQTGDAGGGASHNNMQPFQALKYCVVSR